VPVVVGRVTVISTAPAFSSTERASAGSASAGTASGQFAIASSSIVSVSPLYCVIEA